MSTRLNDVATVNAGDRRLEPQLLRHWPRAGVHATGAQTHDDAARQQLAHGFLITVVDLPVHIEQGSIEVGDEQRQVQFAWGAAVTTETFFL